MNLHALNLNDIRGYGRNKPFLKTAFALRALGISRVPFFNGYISKTLLHGGITAGAELYPAFGAALGESDGSSSFRADLCLYGKLFIAIFVEKNPTRRGRVRCRTEMHEQSQHSPPSSAFIFMVILGQPFITETGSRLDDRKRDCIRRGHCGGLLTGTGEYSRGLLAGIGNTAGTSRQIMSAILDFQPLH